jgi:hypothetical protein
MISLIGSVPNQSSSAASLTTGLNDGEPTMRRYLKDEPTAFDPETISILSGGWTMLGR